MSKKSDNPFHPSAAQVAATMYQTLGTVSAATMPDGEWIRCMDWLREIAQGEPVRELLPVGVKSPDKQRDHNASVAVQAWFDIQVILENYAGKFCSYDDGHWVWDLNVWDRIEDTQVTFTDLEGTGSSVYTLEQFKDQILLFWASDFDQNYPILKT